MKHWVGIILLLLCGSSVNAKAQNIEFVSEMAFPNCGLIDVYAKGCYAYLTGYPYGLRVINISNPHEPYLAGQLDSYSYAEDIQVEGPYAYMCRPVTYTLGVADVSNPAHPDTVGGYGSNQESHGLQVRGNICYLANCGGGLKIFDISDPPRPSLIGVYDSLLWSMAHGIFVTGNLAYLAEWRGGLWIINISNPRNPTFVGHCVDYSWQWTAHEVVVYGDYAYVSKQGYDSGVYIFNVSDPTNPYVAGNWGGLHNCRSVFIWGNCLYTAGDDVRIYDLSDPINPPMIGLYDGSFNIKDVFVTGELILLVGYGRFMILSNNLTSVDEADKIGNRFALSPAYPNPFNASTTISYSLPQPGHVTLSVYNITGQKVATLVDEVEQAGEHRVVWEAGDMPSGVYFARLEANKQSQCIRTTLLK